MSKHTKSPWIIVDKTFVYALNERGTNVFWANLQGGWIGPKADCKTSQEEIEANAILMSMAPDLLEALEDARNKMVSQLILLRCDDQFIQKETATADAAIAKARGEA